MLYTRRWKTLRKEKSRNHLISEDERPLSQPQRQPQRIRSQSQTHVYMNEETNHLHRGRTKTARAAVAHLTLNRPIWGWADTTSGDERGLKIVDKLRRGIPYLVKGE